MTYLARGQVVSAVAPSLGEWLVVEGLVISNPFALTWRVYDVSTDALAVAPVLVSSGSAAQAVDLSFVPLWTVPTGALLGRHEIRWSMTADSGGIAVTWRRQFDVVAVGQSIAARGYALVSEMRAEGLTAARYSDARVLLEIASASKYIERITRRWFEPRRSVATVDGSGGTNLLFDNPVIALESVQLAGATEVMDLEVVRVYNRHLSGGEDDRRSPKLSFYASAYTAGSLEYGTEYGTVFGSARRWLRGSQNITVAGLFGYTDADGSPTGETPELIRRATRLLVVRNIAPMASSAKFDLQNKNRLTGERTREQSYTLGPGRVGSYTGDAEIDDLLDLFMAPPQMGTV